MGKAVASFCYIQHWVGTGVAAYVGMFSGPVIHKTISVVRHYNTSTSTDIAKNERNKAIESHNILKIKREDGGKICESSYP